MNAQQSITIDVGAQSLRFEDLQTGYSQQWLISSAANGVGNTNGSFCTPLGKHIIRAKIGTDAPINGVFIGRRFHGEIYTPELHAKHLERDWILTRILWLSGCETGKNRLGNVDTMRRYVYIHGTPDSTTLGHPGSHGCIRMNNQQLLTLFEHVKVGCPVLIHE